MDPSELLTDAFGRVRELYADLADDLGVETAHRRPEDSGNSIAWLLWHVARLQDDHLAGVSGGPQAWHQGWGERFDLPFDPDDIGFGHASEDVDQVRIADLGELVDYHEVVHRATVDYLGRLDAAELDRVVDHRWDPPVTVGVRLVSLLSDCLQHLGQAAYVKGLPEW